MKASPQSSIDHSHRLCRGIEAIIVPVQIGRTDSPRGVCFGSWHCCKVIRVAIGVAVAVEVKMATILTQIMYKAIILMDQVCGQADTLL